MFGVILHCHYIDKILSRCLSYKVSFCVDCNDPQRHSSLAIHTEEWNWMATANFYAKKAEKRIRTISLFAYRMREQKAAFERKLMRQSIRENPQTPTLARQSLTQVNLHMHVVALFRLCILPEEINCCVNWKPIGTAGFCSMDLFSTCLLVKLKVWTVLTILFAKTEMQVFLGNICLSCPYDGESLHDGAC